MIPTVILSLNCTIAQFIIKLCILNIIRLSEIKILKLLEDLDHIHAIRFHTKTTIYFPVKITSIKVV